MATQDNPPNKIAELPLTAFELPKWLVEPAVRSCRLFSRQGVVVLIDAPHSATLLNDYVIDQVAVGWG
jgi:hypothetical protein